MNETKSCPFTGGACGAGCVLYVRTTVEGRGESRSYEGCALVVLARAASGRVFVAGLGMGIVSRALLSNPNVTAVTVAERNQAVIKLIGPTCADERLSIVHGDALELCYDGDHDTYIFDLWVKSGNRVRKDFPDYGEVMSAMALLRQRNADAKVFAWGLRHPQYNPAVSEVDEDVMQLYLRISRS